MLKKRHPLPAIPRVRLPLAHPRILRAKEIARQAKAQSNANAKVQAKPSRERNTKRNIERRKETRNLARNQVATTTMKRNQELKREMNTITIERHPALKRKTITTIVIINRQKNTSDRTRISTERIPGVKGGESGPGVPGRGPTSLGDETRGLGTIRRTAIDGGTTSMKSMKSTIGMNGVGRSDDARAVDLDIAAELQVISAKGCIHLLFDFDLFLSI